jgi:hypothetical protein
MNTEEIVAESLGNIGLANNNNPNPSNRDSVLTDLWGGEASFGSFPNEALDMSESMKFELEALTIERDRLKKEKKRLSELLESIQLEEDIARLKEEVSSLGGENEQLLVEIQRRRPSVNQ